MALWRSSLDIRFRRGTFHSFACGNSFVNVIIYFYCNPQLGYNFFSVHLLMPTFTPQNIHHHHLNYPTCYISVFLHHCVYPVQHILGDGGFYFVCIHIQSSTLLLHYNICHMEHLDLENSTEGHNEGFRQF